jgi:hypothetical protein
MAFLGDSVVFLHQEWMNPILQVLLVPCSARPSISVPLISQKHATAPWIQLGLSIAQCFQSVPGILPMMA